MNDYEKIINSDSDTTKVLFGKKDLENYEYVYDDDDNKVSIKTKSENNKYKSVIFKIKHKKTNLFKALKVFIENEKDRIQTLKKRYFYINNNFKNLPGLIQASFIEELEVEDIKDNKLHAILMDWVEGIKLNEFIELNKNNKDKIKILAKNFKDIIQKLTEEKIAHNNLESNHIIINPETADIKLISYNNILSKELDSINIINMGNKDFNHTKKILNQKTTNQDAFPSLVIYYSLLIISEIPEFWNIYHEKDNLIFKSKDFEKPKETEIFKKILETDNYYIKYLAERFKKICKMDISNIPNIKQFTANTKLKNTYTSINKNNIKYIVKQNKSLNIKKQDERYFDIITNENKIFKVRFYNYDLVENEIHKKESPVIKLLNKKPFLYNKLYLAYDYIVNIEKNTLDNLIGIIEDSTKKENLTELKYIKKHSLKDNLEFFIDLTKTIIVLNNLNISHTNLKNNIYLNKNNEILIDATMGMLYTKKNKYKTNILKQLIEILKLLEENSNIKLDEIINKRNSLADIYTELKNIYDNMLYCENCNKVFPIRINKNKCPICNSDNIKKDYIKLVKYVKENDGSYKKIDCSKLFYDEQIITNFDIENIEDIKQNEFILSRITKYKTKIFIYSKYKIIIGENGKEKMLEAYRKHYLDTETLFKFPEINKLVYWKIQKREL